MASATNDLITRFIVQTKEFDGNLQRSQKEIKNFQKEISAQVDNVSKGFSSAIGVVGKLAPAIGIAAGGVETFKKIIGSTQSTQDAFNKIVDQGKVAVDVFFESVARGDFSNFKKNMQDAIKAAGEFADALDRLQTRQIHSTAELGEIATEEAKIRSQIAEGRLELRRAELQGDRDAIATQKQYLQDLEGQLTASNDRRIQVKDDLYRKSSEAFQASLKKEFRDMEINERQVLDLLRVSGQDQLAEQSKIYAEKLRLSKLPKYSTSVAVGIAGAMMTTTVTEDQRKERLDAEAWLKTEEGLTYKIAYIAAEHKTDLEDSLNFYNQANAIQAEIYANTENTAKAELKLLNANKETVPTVKTHVEKTKELYQSYDNLVAKAEEFRSKLSEAQHSGDLAGSQYYRNQLGNVNKEIRQLDRIRELENPQRIQPVGLSVQPKKPDISQIIEEAKARAAANTEEARSNYELAKSHEVSAQSWGMLASAIGGISDNPGLRALATSLMILSAVQAVSQSKTKTWVEYAIAAATVAASLISFFSSVNNKKFAGGGVVGDQNLVRMNQGEMILNQAQQTRLFNQISRDEQSTNQTSNVQFTIRGQELVGVLDNHNSKFNSSKNGNY